MGAKRSATILLVSSSRRKLSQRSGRSQLHLELTFAVDVDPVGDTSRQQGVKAEPRTAADPMARTSQSE